MAEDGKIEPLPEKRGGKETAREAWNIYHLELCPSGFWLISFWNIPPGKYMEEQLPYKLVYHGPLQKKTAGGSWHYGVIFVGWYFSKFMFMTFYDLLDVRCFSTEKEQWQVKAQLFFGLKEDPQFLIQNWSLQSLIVVYKGPWGLWQPHFNHRPKIPQEGQIKNCQAAHPLKGEICGNMPSCLFGMV